MLIPNNLLSELDIELLLHVDEISREVELCRDVISEPLLMLLLVELKLSHYSVLNLLLIARDGSQHNLVLTVLEFMLAKAQHEVITQPLDSIKDVNLLFFLWLTFVFFEFLSRSTENLDVTGVIKSAT